MGEKSIKDFQAKGQDMSEAGFGIGMDDVGKTRPLKRRGMKGDAPGQGELRIGAG